MAGPARFSNDALLLIAHGSARYPDAGRTALLHAGTIRAQGPFAAVAVGFLQGSPSPAEALGRLGPRTVHVVPFFMEDGYFTRVAVPASLAGAGGADIRLYPPVGVQDGMAALIEARIAAACPDTRAISVILVGHGSARSPGRPLALHRHADRLRGTGRFAGVRVAFLEEAPFVADSLAATEAASIALIGVFAGEGLHVRDDWPNLIAAGRARHGPIIHDLGTIGDDPGLAALMREQVTGVPTP